MLDALREVQLPLLCLLLSLGAAGKATGPGTPGLARLVPAAARTGLTWAHGAGEVLLAVALLVLTGPLGDAARLAATALFAGGALVLVVLRRRDPEMGCGCFGGLSTAPIGWRVIGRAALLAVASVATVGVHASGRDVLDGLTTTHGVVIAVEVAVLAALSPEVGEVARRLARREPCATRAVSVRRTLVRLWLSDVWRASSATVVGRRPLDVWRQGCWRFLRYAGRRDGRPVDVVFGVPLDGWRPAVRAAITDAETGATLAVVGEAPRDDPPRPASDDMGHPGGGGVSGAPYESV